MICGVTSLTTSTIDTAGIFTLVCMLVHVFMVKLDCCMAWLCCLIHRRHNKLTWMRVWDLSIDTIAKHSNYCKPRRVNDAACTKKAETVTIIAKIRTDYGAQRWYFVERLSWHIAPPRSSIDSGDYRFIRKIHSQNFSERLASSGISLIYIICEPNSKKWQGVH